MKNNITNFKEFFNIFSQNRSDSEQSSEKINDYIQIPTPKVWLLLLALLILTFTVVLWGFYGSIPIQISAKTVLTQNNFFICLIDPSDASSNRFDNCKASIVFKDGFRTSGTARVLDKSPLNTSQLKEKLLPFGISNDWVIEQIKANSFNYPVKIEPENSIPDIYLNEIAIASILLDEVPPVKYLFYQGY